MQLPNKENLEIEDGKIEKYLLNLAHDVGGSKAKFFEKFGYTISNSDDFTKAIKKHGNEREVEKTKESSYGIKYELECEIDTPDGRNPCIISVWMIDKDSDNPRLITAYPN